MHRKATGFGITKAKRVRFHESQRVSSALSRKKYFPVVQTKFELELVMDALQTNWAQKVNRSLKDLNEARKASVALICGSKSISYSQLANSIRSLFHEFKNKHRVRSGTRVMIVFSDEPGAWVAFCIAQIALGLIGACFTVMDTRSKAMNEESRKHMLKLFEPELCISFGSLLVPECIRDSTIAIDCERVLAASTEQTVDFPEESYLSEGAFVDWTSGSTGGLPKGCVCTHMTLMNMYHQKWSTAHGFLRFDETKIVGFNLFFLWYWWQPLCHGGTSVIIQDSELRDLTLLASSMDTHKIDAIDCITPSLLKVIISLYPEGVGFPSKILVSGEALGLDVCEAFMARFPNHDLINVFSTTETGDAGMALVTKSLIDKCVSFGLSTCPIETVLFGAELLVRPIPDEPNPDIGELIVAKVGAREYLGDAIATSRGFSDLGWISRDRVVKLPGNLLSITGRLDDCVKVRGFKIDLKAIEDAAKKFNVRDACAVPDNDRICLFLLIDPDQDVPAKSDVVKNHLRETLSASHVPQIVAVRTLFPLTRTGKLDKRALLKSLEDGHAGASLDASSPTDRVVMAFRKVGLRPLFSESEEVNTCFWIRGGTSLMAISLCQILGIPASRFFDLQFASPKELVELLDEYEGLIYSSVKPVSPGSSGVAIIGMSGRWPGTSGSMTSYDLIRLLESEFNPISVSPHGGAGNVKSGYYLSESDVRGFDLTFWKMQQSSASKIDPHQRIFAEMALEALLDSGSSIQKKKCGVFASSGSLSHFLEELIGENESLADIRQRDPARYLELELGSDKDYISLRTAKLLGLEGPAVTVQAACASALVAIVQAVNAIRLGQCDSAIAGGVSLVTPQDPHASSPGLIWSQDGLCRPFDAEASGTANCNGGHCFVLKRLDLAKEDNDSIYAVIEGVGLNNDGNRGRDFVAPSISGHMQAIRDALADAQIDPSQVGMVEAHGTGTLVGDPMEYSALADAYRSDKVKNSEILSIGSVKGNVGHCNTAAGAFGLAKAVTCMHHETLVKSGSFRTLNPHIQPNPLVQVQDRSEPWKSNKRRFAGISSLGMGGTNCHVIIGNPDRGIPIRKSAPVSRRFKYPILLSSHSESSLNGLLSQMENRLTDDKDTAMTMAFNRPVGRYRLVIKSSEEKLRPSHGPVQDKIETVVLLFPGQGSDFPARGSFVCDKEIVEFFNGVCPVEKFYESGKNPVWGQISLFAISYTVAKATVSLMPEGVGIVCIGHSLGEFAAAVISGLMSLSDALLVVKRRSELLVEYTCTGSMAAVSAPVSEVAPLLESKFPGVEIACINRSDRLTISGLKSDVDMFIKESGFGCKALNTVGGFHSHLADPVASELEKFMNDEKISFPSKTWEYFSLVSTFSGAVVNQLSSRHWAEHVRQPVLMTTSLATIDSLGKDMTTVLFLDIGPGTTMSAIAKHKDRKSVALMSLKDPQWAISDIALTLWECGLVTAERVIPKEPYNRVLGLPTIVWDRTDVWPEKRKVETPRRNKALRSTGSVNDMMYEEGWVPWTPECVGAWSKLTKEFILTDDMEDIVSSAFLGLYHPWVRVDAKGLDSGSLGDLEARLAMRAIRLVQAFAEKRVEDPFIHLSLTFMVPDTVEFGALIGAVRCAISEHPDLNISLVRGTSTPRFLSAGEYKPGPDSGRYKTVLARRLKRVKDSQIDADPIVSGGRFVVTGGLGGIGSALINFLLEARNARHITVFSRRDVVDSVWPVDRVKIVKVDLDSSESVSRGFPEHKVDLVFHLAGEVHDSLLVNVDPENTSEISSGKLNGLISLMQATDSKIIVFSSASAMLGSPGQVLYAAANAAVDVIAEKSERVVSIQWGGWEDRIKNSMSDKFKLKPIEGCERFIGIENGFEAMERIIATGRKKVIGVTDVFDWVVYVEKTQINAGQVSAMFPSPEESWMVTSEQIAVDPGLSWIRDHSDTDGILIPATGLIGALLASSKQLENLEFKEPLRPGRFYRVDTMGTRVALCSSPNWTVNVSAEMVTGIPSFGVVGKRLLNLITSNCWNQTADVANMYRELAIGGFQYGPAFSLVKEALFDSTSAFAEIAVTGDEKFFCLENSIYWKHARILDACTHIASLLDSRASSAFPARMKTVKYIPGRHEKYDELLGGSSKPKCFTAMELSSLSVRSDFGSDVCVDVLVLGSDFSVVMEQLVLTPVHPVEEPLIAVGGPWEDLRPITLSDKPNFDPIIPCGEFEAIITGKLETARIQIHPWMSNVNPHDVRVRVDTYGLSFLDVLAATEVMPAYLFGGEFSGTVIEVGSDVFSVKVGDRITALCQGGFRSTMDVNEKFVSVIPDSMSFERAATVPVSVCTALFAIERARVRHNDTVLVHNASGGLGMALIELLKKEFPEVEIVGSCSDKKRAFVESLGVSRTIDSRDPGSWPLDLRIDVSIGAMHADLLHATLPVMSSFGTIVDVGKRLQAENIHLGLGPFVRGLTYTTAHLDELMRVDTGTVKSLMARAVETELNLPYVVYEDLNRALEHLSSGSHTGKVVLKLVRKPEPPGAANKDSTIDCYQFSERQIARLAAVVEPLGLSLLTWCEFDLANSDPSTIWIYETIRSVESVVDIVCRLPRNKSFEKIAIVPESLVLGPFPNCDLLVARGELLKSITTQGLKESESAWLISKVTSLVGKAELSDGDLEASFESLGIDSLGRLQLWHSFKRQFPHSKISSQFSAETSLRSAVVLTPVTSDRKKWLAIHGFRTNPIVMEHQLGELVKLLGDIELVCVQAPHAARGLCPDGIEDGYEWWSADRDTSYVNGWIGNVGLGESLQYMESVTEGKGFDGVIGFSQGAAIAHHLVGSGLVDRGVLFSPVKPAGGDRINTDSRNLVAVLDPDDGTVGQYPLDGMITIHHKEGHRIPKITKEILDAIDKIRK